MKIKIDKPTTQMNEVLYMLLKRNSINVKQMMFDTGILNLTARISDLRIKHNLNIECETINTTNKFGRSIKYGKCVLTDKETGLKIYKNINNG